MPGNVDLQSADNSQSSEPINSDGSLSASSLSANVNSAFTASPAQTHNSGNTDIIASTNNSADSNAVSNNAIRSHNNGSNSNAVTVSSRAQGTSNSAGGTDQPDCILDVVAYALSSNAASSDPYERSPVSEPTSSSDNPPSYNDLSPYNSPLPEPDPEPEGRPPRFTAVMRKPYDKSAQLQAKKAKGKEAAAAANGKPGDSLTLHITTKLVSASKRLLDFLAVVDKNPKLYYGQTVDNAICRYEYLWLPLLSKYLKKPGSPEIAPPLDVHWIWIVHMLAPQNYKVECEAITGFMIPHRLLTQNSLAIARERGRKLWEENYPHDPWEHFDSSKNVIAPYPSKIAYDLKKAVGRQSAFYYQVSLAHYRSSPFLQPAYQRYRKFLHLKAMEPKKFLVPCYDMDLVWHAHQVHPVSYYNDTVTFLGCLLPHDDSVNDREVGSKLMVSDGITRQLWKTAFNEDFRRQGGMYRGDPPNTYISVPAPQLRILAHTPQYNIFFSKIKFDGKFPEGWLRVKFRHQILPLGDLSLLHEGTSSEHNIESYGLRLALNHQILQNWLVVKAAPEKRLGRLLSKLGGHGRFWCMQDLAELHMCKNGDIIQKEFVEEGSKIQVTMKVERISLPYYVGLSTLYGAFEPIDVPVVKLTAQTGMSVCTEHLSNPRAEASQPSAPELSHLTVVSNLDNVDASSLQNILNAGGLANSASSESKSLDPRIIQLDGSPYMHKKAIDAKPSAPLEVQVKTEDKTRNQSQACSIEHLDTFKVEMATHRLVNTSHPEKPQLLKVEVSHSRALLLSTIHVYSECTPMPWAFDEDNAGESKPSTRQQQQDLASLKLVSLAHTLDPNTLPSPQLMKMANTKWQDSHIAMCDWNAGERAMLVKGAGGKDWAVIIASWTGLKRGVPGTLSKRGVQGSCGELTLRLHCPVNSPAEHISLPYSKSQYDFKVRSCLIDLRTGTVQVKEGEEEFIEHITLGFAITVLHVLCQPRMDAGDMTDGADPPSSVKKLRNRIPVERLTFLAAAGFFCALAPTNQYRRLLSRNAATAKLDRRYSANDCQWPLLIPMMSAYNDAHDAIMDMSSVEDGLVGACGACGGCGGCGGGVASLGHRPQYLWGNSQAGQQDMDDMDYGGDGGGGEGGYDVIGDGAGVASYAAWVGGSGGDAADSSSPFAAGVFGSGGDAGGGGDGGGGDGGGGGCGGGCGGCGGCGG